jgi:hypothetical protein
VDAARDDGLSTIREEFIICRESEWKIELSY